MLRAALLLMFVAAQATANPVPAQAAGVYVGDDRANLHGQIGAGPSALAVTASVRPMARRGALPAARWGDKNGRSNWTRALLAGLRGHASALPKLVPGDIAAYCPAYPTADLEQREAFWVGLVSSLAWHESTHRPHAVGGGGRWYGLVQIYPDTARRYGCKARSGAALKDPEDNLSCALRIMAVTVPRDQVVSRNMRGVAADWGPFHSARKRNDIQGWTRAQSYCTGLNRSLRPVARPTGIGPEPLPPHARPAPGRDEVPGRDVPNAVIQADDTAPDAALDGLIKG